MRYSDFKLALHSKVEGKSVNNLKATSFIASIITNPLTFVSTSETKYRDALKQMGRIRYEPVGKQHSQRLQKSPQNFKLTKKLIGQKSILVGLEQAFSK